MSPATIVGSAKGRSMIELTMLLPRKSSRTVTHAISVPNTAFRITTTADASNVSLRDETAAGLEIARQKLSHPPSVERHTTAARGTSTIRREIAHHEPAREGGRARAG